MLIKLLPES